jgi:hypothetical protein
MISLPTPTECLDNNIDVTKLAKSATTGTLNLMLASADGNANSY